MDALKHDFLQALLKDFQANGAAAIEDARLENPTGYLRVIAQVIPQMVETHAHGEASWAQLLGEFSDKYSKSSSEGKGKDGA